MQDYITLLQEGSRDSKALGEIFLNVFERHLSTNSPLQKGILNTCLAKILSTRGIPKVSASQLHQGQMQANAYTFY